MDQFELKAREMTINVPVIRAKKNGGGGWRLVSPNWVTLSAEQMGASSMLAGASTIDEQKELAQKALADYL